MPKRYNLDHQAVMLDASTPVQPGEAADVPDNQSGHWAKEDPRKGLPAEKAFKAKRDAAASKPGAPTQTSESANAADEEE